MKGGGCGDESGPRGRLGLFGFTDGTELLQMRRGVFEV